MSLLLLFHQQGTPVACAISFTDEAGNLLPPLTRVDLALVTDLPGAAPAFSGFVGVQSAIAPTLYVGATYRASFFGTLGPTQVAYFVAAQSLALAVAPYVSPYQTQTNYAVGQGSSLASLYPRGRLPAVATKPGGIAYRLFYALASVLATIDGQLRAIGAGERLDASKDGQVDSWVADFLGTEIPRLTGEADLAYIARVRAWLQLPFGTLNAVKFNVAAFFALHPDLSTSQDVFDRRSDPARSAYYGLAPGEFAVIEYVPNAAPDDDTFRIGQSFLGQSFVTDQVGSTKSRTAPYPLLSAYVNAVKAIGSVPVYIASTGEQSATSGKWGSPWGSPWGVSSAS